MRAYRQEASGSPGRAGRHPQADAKASAWVRRLLCYTALTVDEQRLLGLLSGDPRRYRTDELVVKAGDPARHMFVVLDGLAGEFKLLNDGHRQIVQYLLPGDMTDPRHLLMPHWDHSICVLSPARIVALDTAAVQQLDDQPNIRQAIARHSMIRQAIAREWLLDVGNRSAFEGVGHLLCEIHARLKAVGLTSGHSFDLPLTQAELGETLALSAVHVNRTLMELRRLRLVTFQNRHAAIHDLSALCASVGFDAAYLRV